MKIGILTFHHVINYGAVLQAISLFNLIKDNFPQYSVEIIDYRPLTTERAYRKDYLRLRKNIKYLGFSYQKYISFRNFLKKEITLSNNRLISDNYNSALRFLKNNKYDVVIVGSDEVWKIVNGINERRFPNIYWLGETISSKKIAFAVSANKTRYRELDEKDKLWISSRLKEFDLIGARDDHTIEMIKYLNMYDENKIKKISDPTFLLEINGKFSCEKLHKLGFDLSKKICGITFYDKKITPILLRILKKQGYQTVGFGFFIPEADINIGYKITPIEWAMLFGSLSLCITNLFHGLIFCLRNKVPFLAFDYMHNEQYSTKIYSLLKDFDFLTSYIIPQKLNLCNKEFENLIFKTCSNMNGNLVDAEIAKKKKESFEFVNLMHKVIHG